jgi:hypothetical protein
VDLGERDEVTAAAIARLAGVGRAAVSNWRRRYPEFPQPVGGSLSSPTFDRAEIEAWLKVTGKADQLATAGQTDTGTQRISEPERSVADLRSGDLLARSMAALLPRETAARLPIEDDAESEALLDASENLPVVLDPACGSGAALLAVADRFGDRVRLAGQEINSKDARTARLSLSGNANGVAYEVYTGDSFLDNQLSRYLGQAAAVVCEPPRDAELAWVQHCYAHLRPRGIAVVVVSQRTCVQSSGKEIRAGLVRSGVLRVVIALPQGMTSVSGTDICLWVLRRPYGEPDHRPVRMIDLSRLGDAVDVPHEFAAWQRLLDTPPLDHGETTVSRAVPRLELLDGEANLLPSRYVTASVRVTAGDLAEVTERLARLYTAIGLGLSGFQAPGRSDKISYITLAELERTGALTIRPRDDTPRRSDVLLRTMERPPVVATGTSADDKGVAQVVEIDESRLDAHFVATFLRTDVAALPVANTLGAVSREDLRRCRIPRMPLAEQQRYGEAFRRLLELDVALRALADVSGKVIEQTIHGLTTGVVEPGGEATKGETSKR